ncbi:hypothetical protein Slin14017_G083220 [Septoria linicola]|nr:hypothetical protein Slin14017_G083220 [Septoria linicola]
MQQSIRREVSALGLSCLRKDEHLRTPSASWACQRASEETDIRVPSPTNSEAERARLRAYNPLNSTPTRVEILLASAARHIHLTNIDGIHPAAPTEGPPNPSQDMENDNRSASSLDRNFMFPAVPARLCGTANHASPQAHSLPTGAVQTAGESAATRSVGSSDPSSVLEIASLSLKDIGLDGQEALRLWVKAGDALQLAGKEQAMINIAELVAILAFGRTAWGDAVRRWTTISDDGLISRWSGSSRSE